jgi:hypothetical protein
VQEIIETIKSKNLKEVFFGSNGFRIADEASINDLQLGYSVHPDRSDLRGSNEGDWQKSWVVIGTDTNVGDPYFVDTSDASLPVYTAMHGMGEWDAELVSTSLTSFLEVLAYLDSVSKQDFARIDPDESTITDPEELAAIEKKLQEISGEKYYWQNFIEQHQEWVEEFGS